MVAAVTRKVFAFSGRIIGEELHTVPTSAYGITHANGSKMLYSQLGRRRRRHHGYRAPQNLKEIRLKKF